jgi:hypothetical protein
MPKMKIGCIGTQNTGKTTFIKDLITTYPQFTTPNKTYRDVIRKYGLKINQNATIAHQWIIFCNVLETVNKRYSKSVVFDRTPFDAYIYTLYAAGKPDGLEEMRELAVQPLEKLDMIFMFPIAGKLDGLKEMRELAVQSLEKLDMIFMFPIAGNEHIPLKADGLRDIDENYRETINALFLRELALAAARTDKLPPIYNVTGVRHDRIAFAAEKLGLSSSIILPQE